MTTTPHTAERVNIYVDGFNLYFGLRSQNLRRYYWLDINALAVNLLKKDQRLGQAKYFTSRVSGPKDSDTSEPARELRSARKRQNDYLEALTISGLHIYYGQFLDKGGSCHTCGATWPAHEEKMTDVNIATELLSDAFTNSFDSALVISADSDLVPPIRAIRRFFPEKRVIVAFPPGRASKAMRNTAHAYLTIGHTTPANSQFPNEIPKPDGHIISRPPKWQ